MSFRGKAPPKGYIPGLGRGAVGFTTRGDVGPAAAAPTADAGGSRAAQVRASKMAQREVVAEPVGQYDPFDGYQERPSNQQYDQEDEEADRIWEAIDERMNHRKRKQRDEQQPEEGDAMRSKIEVQFRELKSELANVTEDEWLSIPDVGDYSLRYKQSRKQEVFTPLADTLIDQRSKANLDATAGNKALAATTLAQDESGFQTSVANLSGLGAARGTVLGMSLDKMSDAVGGQTVIDPQGYLTSLQTSAVTNVDVADVNKARLLLKSVRDTNPRHGPGWIAAARVEETAGKILQARKIIQEACEICPENEDVWLEAARLHPPNVARSILATAVRHTPHSIKIYLKAADLESSEKAKKAILRKALEANPTSVKLWKAAIDLEDAEDAKILLSVAVEKIPHSVEMWLALARLESYENAQRVLNKARKALPAERSIWIAAAKLEEAQNHKDLVDKIIDRAVRALKKNEAAITRAQWLEEAEKAEATGAPLTSAAIVRHTIGMDVEDEDRQRTWADDAKSVLVNGSVDTARAILAHALAAFPKKRSLWSQVVELERKHGTRETLDNVLADACEQLPRVEIFWLLRAKECWLHGDVEKSREILATAFEANPDSEAIWLAASKLEWENGEIIRARLLLQRARERAPSGRVYMKSAVLEREQQNIDDALNLIEEGIKKYPTFGKLYMIGGQICSDDLPLEKKSLDRARKYYQRGLEVLSNNIVLWILASRLEERAPLFDPENIKPGVGTTKARSLLEIARLKNPKNPELWLEAVRLERRAGNAKLADTMMSKALQECPTSGLLRAEAIMTAPRVEQKSKSTDAIKRCPDDPLVIAAVASLFAAERKIEKARKWFDRAVVLNPDLGDSWARYYAFELEVGTKEQQENVKERCIAAEPRHGEIWVSVMKDMKNRHLGIGDGLEMVTKKVQESHRISHF